MRCHALLVLIVQILRRAPSDEPDEEATIHDRICAVISQIVWTQKGV